MFHTIKSGEEYATLPDAEFLSAIKEFLPSGSDVEQREDNGRFVFRSWRGTDHYQQFTLEAMDRNVAAAFAAAFAAGLQHAEARNELAKEKHRKRVELEGNLTRVDMLTASALGGLITNSACRDHYSEHRLAHNALDMAMHAECALLDLHVARHGSAGTKHFLQIREKAQAMRDKDSGRMPVLPEPVVFNDGETTVIVRSVGADVVTLQSIDGVHDFTLPLRDFHSDWSPGTAPVAEGDTGHVDLRVDGEAVAVFTDGTESGKPLAVHSDGVYVEHTGGNVSVVPVRDFLLYWYRVPPAGEPVADAEPPAGGGE